MNRPSRVMGADTPIRCVALRTLSNISSRRTGHRNRAPARMTLLVVFFQQIIFIGRRRRCSTRKFRGIVLRLICRGRKFSPCFRTSRSLSHCSGPLYGFKIFLSKPIGHPLQNPPRSSHFNNLIQLPLLAFINSQQHRSY